RGRDGNPNHSVCVRYGQRPKDKEIRQAEQGCSHAQSKSHRYHNTERQSFRPFDRTKAVTKIQNQILNPPGSSNVAAFIPARTDGTHGAQRGISRPFCTKTCLEPFIDFLFEVILHFFVEILLDALAEHCGANDDAKPTKPAEHSVISLSYTAR